MPVPQQLQQQQQQRQPQLYRTVKIARECEEHGPCPPPLFPITAGCPPQPCQQPAAPHLFCVAGQHGPQRQADLVDSQGRRPAPILAIIQYVKADVAVAVVETCDGVTVWQCAAQSNGVWKSVSRVSCACAAAVSCCKHAVALPVHPSRHLTHSTQGKGIRLQQASTTCQPAALSALPPLPPACMCGCPALSSLPPSLTCICVGVWVWVTGTPPLAAQGGTCP